MSIESSETEHISLGDLLSQTRVKQGLDLEQISTETKITIANLKAMEENDFSSLPAEAYARGFYTLYAKALALDPAEVLRIYSEEKVHHSSPENQSIPPPYIRAKQVRSMTTRPTIIPTSCTGLIIFAILLVGALLCWYYSWNPATFLSDKLRSFQKPAESQQKIQNNDEPGRDSPLFEIAPNKTNGRASKETKQLMPESTPAQ